MSKQTLGKKYLRNIIRHTDAHNKIQEETEMWKMRDMEVNHVSDEKTTRGHMHCDRMSYQSRVSSDHDDREARYWTRKLYEFEDNDPDRWGHSGFKELYPEEFGSGSDKSSSSKKTEQRRHKESRSRHSKRSSHKKKKRKKEAEEGKRKRSEWSCADRSSDGGGNADKDKERETKSRHRSKKSDKTRERRDEEDEGRGRRTHSHKRRNPDSHKRSDSKKKRRKDWRAAGEKSSDESSGE
ncbi:NKAP domain containing 1 isoform X2 [Entelurus aequoreus]|nr:NKAP domain containing 1 isoform X2 [Entelurus aequoreus]